MRATAELRSPQGVDLECRRCALAADRTQVVPGSGNPRAELALVGEAPGAREDELGVPFVGRAGSILDSVLEEAGMRREDLWIANVVRCRPPGNRAPRPVEVATCSFQLDAELSSVRPGALVLLGGTAASAMLGRKVAVASEAGDVHRVRRAGLELPCVVTYHPAGLIYRPAARREVVEHLVLGLELARR